MTALYPEIKIDRIKNPNRFYAVPLLGFVVKIFMIIPVALELWVLHFAQFFFTILNACNIFFRGRYWKLAYQFNLGVMQFETNTGFFVFGITDVYPGFSLKTTNYDLSIDFNKNPNRILATPLLGMLFRFVLMIPYLIYSQVLSTAAFLSFIVGWIWVLFSGHYPETTYEIIRDSIRVNVATSFYFLGMSDAYPSWWMSFNHKVLKIILLVIASLLFLGNFSGHFIPLGGNHMQKNYHMNVQQKNPYQY